MSGDRYQFCYTVGAKKSRNFTPFGRMHELQKEYVSPQLFAFFANRLIPKSRPDYADFVSWVGLDLLTDEPLELLARSGGQRKTDNILIFPRPSRTRDGFYESYFFIHGIRHMPPTALDRVGSLVGGERLFPMFDVQNEYDREAVGVRTKDAPTLIGYCPRFLASDIGSLVEKQDNDSAMLRVVRVNKDAPVQFRLLCQFRAKWPEEFSPCDGPEYQLIAKGQVVVAA